MATIANAGHSPPAAEAGARKGPKPYMNPYVAGVGRGPVSYTHLTLPTKGEV